MSRSASIFMLWYAPSTSGKTEIPFVKRAEDAITYYKNKHGFLPAKLLARPTEIPEGITTVLGVTIVPETGVTPKHFLLGEL